MKWVAMVCHFQWLVMAKRAWWPFKVITLSVTQFNKRYKSLHATRFYFLWHHPLTCMWLVNVMQSDMSREKIFSSSWLVSMQSFRQLSRKLVWWHSTSSMLEACPWTAETHG